MVLLTTEDPLLNTYCCILYLSLSVKPRKHLLVSYIYSFTYVLFYFYLSLLRTIDTTNEDNIE